MRASSKDFRNSNNVNLDEISSETLYVLDLMVMVAHEPYKDLCTLKYTLLAVPSCITPPERAVRVLKVETRHRQPYLVHLIWG